MELPPEEENPQEQRQKADPLSTAMHVLFKTELRTEWLRGQGFKSFALKDLHTVLTYSIGRSASAIAETARQDLGSVLLEVAVHQVDEFFRGFRLLGGLLLAGIDNVIAHVTLQNFGHQTINGPAARRDGLQDFRALFIRLQSLFNACKLPLDSPDALEELLPVFRRMRHALSSLVFQ